MTRTESYKVREAKKIEYAKIGQLMVKVYSKLEGFPSLSEQPNYYNMLLNVGIFTKSPKTKILLASTASGKIAGAVVYFGDMFYYGSGGIATKEKNASGFRLLAVDIDERGRGVGKLLTEKCIDLAKEEKQKQVIIHSTQSMQIAWKMYENLGFKRSEDLDFMQGKLPVYGFRLYLKKLN